jgi:DNA-binding NarL/FixJ family response regulator
MAGEAPPRIRVYLVDDHAVVREGVAWTLADEPDMELVGQAGNGADALKETLALRPEVVIVDLGMPDRDGIDLLESLRAQLPATKLLVLTCHEDESRVVDALHAGAHGYLVKTSTLAEIVHGIRGVTRGSAPISAHLAHAAVGATRPSAREPGDGALESLTARERQVFRLLAEGATTRVTAARLTISPKTVETHRVRIYAKLGCKNAIELTRIAVRAGMIDA